MIFKNLQKLSTLCVYNVFNKSLESVDKLDEFVRKLEQEKIINIFFHLSQCYQHSATHIILYINYLLITSYTTYQHCQQCIIIIIKF